VKDLSTFTKFFLGTALWTFGFLGIAAYASEKAFQADPEIIKKVEKGLGQEYMDNVKISFGENDGEDTTDVWNLKPPRQTLAIRTVASDVTIKRGQGSMVVIKAAGRLDKSRAEKLLVIHQTDQMLEIREPDDGAVSSSAVTIEIPESFRKEIDFKTVSGDLRIERLVLQKLSIKTVSGDIQLNEMGVQEGSFKTFSGDILLENEKPANLDIVTVSGNVALNLSENLPETEFSLLSVSGDIENSHPSTTKKAAFSVNVKTTSGDIRIE